MSVRQAKLASSPEELQCPQHPSGLWCKRATWASRQRFLPNAEAHSLSVPQAPLRRRTVLSQWTDAAGSQRSSGTTGEKLIKRRQRRLLLSRLPRPEACKEPGRLGCELTSPGAEPLPPRFRPISPKPGNRLSSPAAAGAIPPQFCESRSPRPEARDPAPFSEGEGPGGPGTLPHAAVGGPGRVGGCSQSD